MVRRGGTVLAVLALVQAASGAGVLVPPGQAAGAVVAPTVPPTSVGLMDFFQQPEDLRCLQLVRPPGVKPASCMQVTCMPETLQVGDQFSVTVRFCLRRPRRWHLTFALLDMKTKEYYMGNGASIAAGQESQCGEVTFTQALSTPPGARDLMWKFYIAPTWGTATDYVEDTFPNMLAEAGVPEQPDYMRPLPPAALCRESAPNPRLWSFPPTGLQNAIDYAVVPPCLTPGTTWALAVRTHLETQARADLHCNLQLGSGADKYLGADDVYLTETDVWGLEANSVAASWSALPPGYWTLHDIVFTPAQTRMVRPGAPVYAVCFLVPAGASFGEDVPGTWTLLDREFFTSVQFCPAALPAAAAAIPASAAPAATGAAATAAVAPAAAAAAAAATAAAAAPLPAVPPRLRSGQRRVVEVSASSDQQQL